MKVKIKKIFNFRKWRFVCKVFFVASYYAFRHPRKFWNALSARGKKWVMRGMIFLLIILIAVPASFWYQARHAKAAWWDDSWMYRQKIQLTNSTGSTLSDFQIAITVDTASLITAGKMQATTCADLRFTDSTGKILPYWIEENGPGCNNAATKVWLKVPSVYNGTNATNVYMYYGNPSATAAQDGNKVFEFFDDFHGTTIDENLINYGGGIVAQNDELSIVNNADGWDNYAYTDNTFVRSKVFYARVKADSGTRAMVGWHDSGTGASYSDQVYALYFNSGTFAVYEDGTSKGSFVTYTVGSWYDVKIELKSTGAVYYYKDSGASMWTTLYTSTFSTEDNLRPSFTHYDVTEHSYTDNWFVTKYASADPTTSVAAEEVGPGPAGYWKFDDGQGGTAQDSSSNNLDGTITGATWKPESECVSGKCLRFNGSPNNITVGDPANGALDFGSSKSFSISSWIKLQPNAANYNGVIGKCGQDNSCAGYELFTSGNGTGISLRLTWLGGPQYGMSVSGSFNFADNKYHHVAAVLNRSNNRGYLYVDGNQIASADTSSVGNLDNANNLTMGLNGAGYWSGYLDETKVYPYARTADQIKQDYNSGLAAQSSNSGSSAAIGGDSPKWMSDGLVGYWKMDESSWAGTTGEVADASGNGNNGTAAGGATTAAGKFGNGGAFISASSQYVSIANNTSLNPTGNSMTMSAWVKPTALPGSTHQRLINKNSTTGYMLNIYSTYAEVYFGGQNVTGPTLTAGEWVHLTAVAGNGRVKIYKNGVQTTDTALTGTIDGGSTILALASASSPGSYFGGTMDDVRVYNRALAPDEVKQLSEWAPGPVGWWKMDEKSGTTAYDNSGNGENGVLTSMDATTDWVQGKYGNALDFDGSDDYINLNNAGTSATIPAGDIGFGDTNNFTLTMWYKGNDTDSYTYGTGLIGRDNGDIYANLVLKDGYVEYLHYDSAWLHNIRSTTLVADNNWHYITYVNYSNETGDLYIDGKKEISGQSSSISGARYFKADFLMRAYSAKYATGNVDDVRIYNYARTQKQIEQDMEGGVAAAEGGSSGPLPDPIGYWKFDEGQSGTAYDSSPNGFNGTLTNGAAWSNNGKFGKAVLYDGSDDFTSISDNNKLDFGTGDFTVSGWMNVDSTKVVADSEYGFVNKNSTFQNSAGWGIELSSYGKTSPFPTLNVQAFNSGQTSWCNTCASLTDGITTNAWHHVVFMRSGSYMKLYIDGQFVAQNNHAQVATSVDNGQPIVIGDHAWGPNFPGLIDEVKIYNSDLSNEQVKEDMNQGKSLMMGSVGMSSAGAPSNAASQEYCVPGDATSCAGPIAELKLDDGTGTTAKDTSGNAYDLSFTNTPTWSQGKIGKALDFDNDDYASKDWADFSLGPQTIEFWMKADTINASWRDIIGTTLNSDVNRFHLQSTDNSVVFYSVLGACGTLDSDVIPVPGQWYHVAGTTDGTTMKIYINGQMKKSAACATASYTSTGVWVGGTTEDFDGQIDQIQIFNYARTSAQIAWDYNRGGPAGWWKLDETEGDQAHDWSGNGNVGTLTTMDPPSDWVSGKLGNALDFDGTDDRVEIPDYASLDIPSQITMSAWIYPTTFSNANGGSYPTIISKGSNYRWFIGTSNSKAYARFTGFSDLVTSSTIPLNTWTYLTLTYDGNGFKWYINGVLDNSDSQTGALTPDSSTWYIGDYASTRYFQGKIDDVRIYNYALTPEQVKQVMNGGAAVKYGE